MYPHKREAEENVTHRRGEGKMTMRETAVMGSKPRDVDSYQKLEEARNGFSPRASGESLEGPANTFI